SQTVIESQQGNRLLTAIVGRDYSTDEMFLNLVMPLGVDFSSDIKMMIDETEIAPARINTCDQTGCLASLKLNDPIIEKLKTGSTLLVNLQIYRGQELGLQLTLKDFTRSFALVN
ncbi:MAG TPA: invasion associated locus B family protein, partial [Paracoccaceae bacterium]|nr:invasion associated locus B family protein [Paracoccaceae bacterium]